MRLADPNTIVGGPLGCTYEPASSVFAAVAQVPRATNWDFARQAN